MKLLVFVFLFIFFASGLLFVHRMLMQLQQERIFATSTLTKIGTVFFLSLVLFAALMPMRFAMITICVLQAMFSFLMSAVARFRENHFKKSALAVIEEIVLSMKTGRSFRHAFEDAKRSCDAFTQQKLAEIMSLVAFSQQTETSVMSKFAKFLVEEFTHVDQKPYRSIQRLEILRTRLKMERNFRRRSGDAVKQVRLQALVLLILYICMFVAVSQHVQLVQYLSLLMTSMMLMLTGYVLMWWLVRSFRWKV